MAGAQKSSRIVGKPVVGTAAATTKVPRKLKVVVGQGEDIREFVVRESQVATRSKSFSDALREGPKDTAEIVLELPDDDPQVFALYSKLLDTGTVPALQEIQNRTHIGDDGHIYCRNRSACMIEYHTLVGLYVFARQIADVKAQNAAIDGVIAKVTHESTTVVNPHAGPCLPTVGAIKTMYSQTKKHCPGRQAILDCFVWYGQAETLHECGSWIEAPPEEFMLDLARNLMSLRNQPTQNIPHHDLTRYHEPEGEDYEWDMMPWSSMEHYQGFSN
ncbi:hypothetical protein EK21DRAFT_115563 [Setomelanomma holmii]|uniref:BTB domain-containing protein n=1 Tax=Setomelanomma holmii TaxID=210430 RepID=A0A9P4H348_9PLEO|nr:hypothetical protein EK21DRAFT_115563 [Setomelanomma holmii]